MSGSMYDLSCMTFSPDGRIFQVEYASKAVENGETIVGVVCKDGVLLGTEKLMVSKMLVEGSHRRIFNVHDNIGIVVGGRIPDGKNVMQRARDEAFQYKQNYAINVPGSVLVERVSQYVHSHTLYTEYRPFGTAAIIAAYDELDGYSLNMVEPSGFFLGYFGCANGRGKQICKSHLDKTDFKSLTCREALFNVAKMLHLCHEEFKEKKFELELSWICPESKNRHEMVPKELREDAEKRALESIEEDQMAE